MQNFKRIISKTRRNVSLNELKTSRARLVWKVN